MTGQHVPDDPTPDPTDDSTPGRPADGPAEPRADGDCERAPARTYAGRLFGGDDRAVSEVLGAVLVFGIIVMLLVLIQVNAVPAQNQQVEFEHNQRVQADLLDLDRAILQSATADVPGSTRIEMSARYPSRFFLLNPSVKSGTVDTLSAADITVRNAESPTADNYWTGDPLTFPTRTIRYRPSYQEYRNPPETLYEHNTLINSFDEDTALPVDSGSFIDGSEIVLVTVDGSFSRASTDSLALQTTPLSAPAQTVPIESDASDPVSIEFPTTLSKSAWETILEDEMVSVGGRIEAPLEWNSGDPYNTLTVTLAPGTYDLRMARVAVGGDVDETQVQPYYLAATDGNDGATLRHGETRALDVEVRDKFNNAVDGEVTWEAAGGTFVPDSGSATATLPDQPTEDGESTVLFQLDSTTTTSATVTATLGDPSGALPRETVTFTIPVADESESGGTGDDPVGSINPSESGSVRLERAIRSGNSVFLNFSNSGAVNRSIDEVRIMFYVPSASRSTATDALVEGEPVQVAGPWYDLANDILVATTGETRVEVDFDPTNPNKAFFGLAVEFANGDTSNYFVQAQ